MLRRGVWVTAPSSSPTALSSIQRFKKVWFRCGTPYLVRSRPTDEPFPYECPSLSVHQWLVWWSWTAACSTPHSAPKAQVIHLAFFLQLKQTKITHTIPRTQFSPWEEKSKRINCMWQILNVQLPLQSPTGIMELFEWKWEDNWLNNLLRILLIARILKHSIIMCRYN